jgi:hypothetical protein
MGILRFDFEKEASEVYSSSSVPCDIPTDMMA